MKIVRVEYTLTHTEKAGKIASVNKKQILSDLDSTNSENIQPVLESYI
ncbi:MAG: hypothetical protein KC643_26210 [Nitrospira sp.]|nr:hypothetical protein [Nitrospira sp.]MCA9500421.1 hypothetical protein [Nitrospira sp.]